VEVPITLYPVFEDVLSLLDLAPSARLAGVRLLNFFDDDPSHPLRTTYTIGFPNPPPVLFAHRLPDVRVTIVTGILHNMSQAQPQSMTSKVWRLTNRAVHAHGTLFTFSTTFFIVWPHLNPRLPVSLLFLGPLSLLFTPQPPLSFTRFMRPTQRTPPLTQT
jgi:hypothetical protein